MPDLIVTQPAKEFKKTIEQITIRERGKYLEENKETKEMDIIQKLLFCYTRDYKAIPFSKVFSSTPIKPEMVFCLRIKYYRPQM